MKTSFHSFVASIALMGAFAASAGYAMEGGGTVTWGSSTPAAPATTAGIPAMGTAPQPAGFTPSADSAKAAQDVAAKDKEAKDACSAAKAKAAANPEGPAQADVVAKCPAAAVNTPNPAGVGRLAHNSEPSPDPTSASAAMFNNQITAQTKDLNNVKMLTSDQVKTTSFGGAGSQVANLNPALFDKKTVLDNATLTNSVTQGNQVATQSISGQAYRDSVGKATVVIGGWGGDGINGKAPDGKSIDWSDAEYIKTDTETARAVRFGGDPESVTMKQGEFNTSLPAPKGVTAWDAASQSMKPMTSADMEMATYIDAQAKAAGLSDAGRQALLTKLRLESGFDTFSYAKTSSATGLGQYLSGSWKELAAPGLNRNVTDDQIATVIKETKTRENQFYNTGATTTVNGVKHVNSAADLQAEYGTFANYDYACHHDGNGACQVLDGQHDGVNILNSQGNLSSGAKVFNTAEAALNGQAIDGSIVASNSGTPNVGGGGNSSGGGVMNTVQQVIAAASGGNQNAINSLVTAAMGGNTQAANALSQLAAGGGSSPLASLLGGGGSANTSNSGGQYAGTTTDDPGDKPYATPLTGYQLVKAQEILKACGQTLPATDNEVLVQVARCKASGKVPETVAADDTATTDDTVTK